MWFSRSCIPPMRRGHTMERGPRRTSLRHGRTRHARTSPACRRCPAIRARTTLPLTHPASCSKRDGLFPPRSRTCSRRHRSRFRRSRPLNSLSEQQAYPSLPRSPSRSAPTAFLSAIQGPRPLPPDKVPGHRARRAGSLSLRPDTAGPVHDAGFPPHHDGTDRSSLHLHEVRQ